MGRLETMPANGPLLNNTLTSYRSKLLGYARNPLFMLFSGFQRISDKRLVQQIHNIHKTLAKIYIDIIKKPQECLILVVDFPEEKSGAFRKVIVNLNEDGTGTVLDVIKIRQKPGERPRIFPPPQNITEKNIEVVRTCVETAEEIYKQTKALYDESRQKISGR